MVKEELVSAVEGKKKTSPGREAEKREGKELPRRDEPEDFQTLYEESLKTLEEGQILRGIVVDITPDHVTVDVGYKSEGEVIGGEIVGKVKGGLSVDIGRIQAFLPGSQIDLKPVRSLDALIGQRLKFKVIKFNRKRNNIVLSRRVLLDEERKQLREETLINLKEGDVMEGTG